MELRSVVERAGVVHENVDRTELLDRTGESCIDLTALGDVAPDGERASSHPADLLDGLLGVHEPLLARDCGERAVAVGVFRKLRLDEQVGDDDVSPRACERQGIRSAKPARAAGDERDASAEVDLNAHEDGA